jgi:hypothetical protein
MGDKMESFQEEWDAVHSEKEVKFKKLDYPILKIRTDRGFLYRLWFLISAPIMWLITGEIEIK